MAEEQGCTLVGQFLESEDKREWKEHKRVIVIFAFGSDNHSAIDQRHCSIRSYTTISVTIYDNGQPQHVLGKDNWDGKLSANTSDDKKVNALQHRDRVFVAVIYAKRPKAGAMDKSHRNNHYHCLTGFIMIEKL